MLCVLIHSAVSLKIAETEQPYLVKRMIGGLENVLFSTCYQTLQGKEPRVLSVNLSEARDNSTWAVSWLAELTVTPLPSPSFFPPLPRVSVQKTSVCRFKTSPCAPAPRPHVTQHNTTQHNTTQHNTTQHNTTQHNTTQHNTTQHNTTQHNTTQHNTTQHNTTQHNTTQHNTTHTHNTTQHDATTHNTTHGDRDGERQRETEKEDTTRRKREKRSEEKREERR